MAERVIMTIHCETCPLYADPMIKLIYPNTDNDKIGWVRCGAGNTVKRKTGACHRHPMKLEGQMAETVVEDRKLVKTVSQPRPNPKPKPKPKVDEGLLGGVDFEKQLLADIEAMAGGI